MSRGNECQYSIGSKSGRNSVPVTRLVPHPNTDRASTHTHTHAHTLTHTHGEGKYICTHAYMLTQTHAHTCMHTHAHPSNFS